MNRNVAPVELPQEAVAPNDLHSSAWLVLGK